MPDTRLSPHFALAEFAVSAAHPELVVPVPTRFVPQLKKLVDTVVEPLRVALGPLRVLSGYRSPALNTAVGGSPTSQHVAGEACDLTPFVGPRRALALFDWLRAHPMPHGQCIWYPAQNFVHVALPSDRFPTRTFCVHDPVQGLHYAIVGETTNVAHLDSRAAA